MAAHLTPAERAGGWFMVLVVLGWYDSLARWTGAGGQMAANRPPASSPSPLRAGVRPGLESAQGRSPFGAMGSVAHLAATPKAGSGWFALTVTGSPLTREVVPDPPEGCLWPMLWRVAWRLAVEHEVFEGGLEFMERMYCRVCGEPWPCSGRRLGERGLLAIAGPNRGDTGRDSAVRPWWVGSPDG